MNIVADPSFLHIRPTWSSIYMDAEKVLASSQTQVMLDL